MCVWGWGWEGVGAGTSPIRTLKKECFEIGEPAELQIGHVRDAIVAEMQHLQAGHQRLQASRRQRLPLTQQQREERGRLFPGLSGAKWLDLRSGKGT